MAVFLRNIYITYHRFLQDHSDHRGDNYLFASGPIQPIIVAFLYLHLVLKFLPKYMKDRPAYDLRNPIILFNFSQVVINLYIFIFGSIAICHVNWDCATVDYSNDPQALNQLNLAYLYYITKMFDLLDTIFFVLRKKDSHISFLHVYHHGGMVLGGFIGFRFIGGGHSLFLGYLNAIVHIFMYTYYMLTAWDGKFKRFGARFKKHITQLQLFQFSCFFFIYGRLLFKPDCGYPKIVTFFLTTQAVFFLFLFGEFYYKAYLKAPTSKNNKNI